MQILTLLPFLMELRINFPPFDRTLEYNYNLRKNITVFRDPLQTTLYTGSVTCQTEATTNNSLLCLLHYIDVYSSLTFETLNTTNEVTYEKYYPDDWFIIKFNKHGIEELLVNSTTDKKDLIKEIAFQFHIGGEIIPKYVMKEKLVVGHCMTLFNVNSSIDEYKGAEKELEKQIILPIYASYYEGNSRYRGHERHVHIYIEKIRDDCQYSLPFFDFLNGMEVAKYIHAIEILDDKLNISTTMDVRLPADPWNPKGTLVFRETTQLDLISITSRTKVFHSYMRDNYRWIDLME
ncbi:PREDICTED: uncharacterized protein LOC108759890 [Trachymyrmex cornetzi]|uniref:uncharacterized protein LOC108759890 n=1 Tax=Trachymyrmex cornetzi TaxID=471704 RepID=UPI00084F74FE|nr:PREDICTED: uncharacterized protein LOC108759890 [Trachymyrmex cornetzi]